MNTFYEVYITQFHVIAAQDSNIYGILCHFLFLNSAKEVNGSITHALGWRQKLDSKGSGIVQHADYNQSLNDCIYYCTVLGPFVVTIIFPVYFG